MSEPEAWARMHDGATLDAYGAAIGQTVATFYAEQGRYPTALVVGAGGGSIAQMCLQAGAATVTVVDPCKASLDAVHAALAAAFPDHGDRYRCVCTSPYRLPGSTKYDVLVLDAFGSVLNARAAAVVAWDLKRVQRKFAGDAYYSIPDSGNLTAVVVHAPVAALDPKPGNRSGKAKWIGARAAIGAEPSSRTAIAVSDRADLVTEWYDTAKKPIEFAESVSLAVPDGVPLAECFVLLEWSITLGDRAAGMRLADWEWDSAVHWHARMKAWGGFTACRLLDLVDCPGPVTLKVDYRANGVQLKRIDGQPSATIRDVDRKKLEQWIDTAFAKAATAAHAE